MYGPGLSQALTAAPWDLRWAAMKTHAAMGSWPTYIHILCIYICIYICVFMYIYTYMYMMYMYMYVGTYLYIYIYIWELA